DLNTPMAISHLHELAHQLNKSSDPTDQARLKGHLVAGGAVLGLVQADPEDWFKGAEIVVSAGALKLTGYAPSITIEVSPESIDRLIEEREQARNSKEFEEREQARNSKEFAIADEIRNRLAAQGIILEDSKDGTTTWRRAG
ncbi:MAG: DALR domain-containing protein, partial [Alphaproteobacteria bacterium]